MNRGLNSKLIFKVLGSLLLVEAVFLLLPIPVALFYGEHETVPYYLITIAVALVIGFLLMFAGRKADVNIMGKREGAVIVTATWLLYTLIGSLPFWLSGNILSFTDAFFETLSGFTTTGTSILNDIESMPYNILFWRSMTHWIGGLGIIVIFLAVLPLVGGSVYQLFNAEGTLPMHEKISPRTNHMAKTLLIVYVTLTVLATLSLYLVGMNWFDAVNHALSTVSTGGFSTKQESIAYFQSPAIEYVIIFFMFFSGVNFTLYYFLYKLSFDKIKGNEELKFYLIFLFAAALIIFLSHVDFSNITSLRDVENSFRNSLFITTSCMSTTGMATEDYTLWGAHTWVVMLVLMVIGASAYSTSGGLKISRVVLVIKFSYYEFKKMVHPNAVVPVKFNGRLVKDDLLFRIMAFSLIYLMLIVAGTFILSLSGLGFIESASGMITCMSDVGLGLGELGPSHSFAEIPFFSKWFLAFVMLIGRLEIYSVLLLFTPVFWRG